MLGKEILTYATTWMNLEDIMLGEVVTKEQTLYVSAAKSLQLCPTLCDPVDDSPPGFAVPGILQARILEWVAISFSNA